MLDDHEEGQLLYLLMKLLPPSEAGKIERASMMTNFRWSDVVGIGLATVDWEIVVKACNAADDTEAVLEAEDILN